MAPDLDRTASQRERLSARYRSSPWLRWTTIVITVLVAWLLLFWVLNRPFMSHHPAPAPVQTTQGVSADMQMFPV